MKETIVKINITKSWFFEKIKKKNLTNPQPDSSREKERRPKSMKLEGEVRTDNAKIQRIIRDQYEQLYGNKIDNLEEMDRFLKTVQSSKTVPGRNRNYEQPNNKY